MNVDPTDEDAAELNRLTTDMKAILASIRVAHYRLARTPEAREAETELAVLVKLRDDLMARLGQTLVRLVSKGYTVNLVPAVAVPTTPPSTATVDQPSPPAVESKLGTAVVRQASTSTGSLSGR